MSTTCIVEASSLMMRPMASAMRPETPVSISSKMIVGSCMRSASSALIASITRDSSPPEAMRSTGWGAAVRLAVKRNSTRSRPVRVGAPVSVIPMRNSVSGMPNWASVARMRFSNAGAALRREAWRRAARASAASAASAVRASSAAMRSSPCSMASSRAA